MHADVSCSVTVTFCHSLFYYRQARITVSFAKFAGIFNSVYVICHFISGTEIVKRKVETESSSTETDQKLSRQKSQQDSLERNRKKLHRKSSLVVEQSESPSKNTSQRTVISKPLEAVRNNTIDSKSDSSSSIQYRNNLKNGEEKDEPGGGVSKMEDGVELQGRMTCSPGVDLTSNPNVTFVSNTSIPDLR